MLTEVVKKVTNIKLSLNAEEAHELYTELYRLGIYGHTADVNLPKMLGEIYMKLHSYGMDT